MSDPDVRPPAVAGQFYPKRADDLRHMVEAFFGEVDAAPRPTCAVIAPHAGLMFSGQCAAHVFRRSTIPTTVVILAPNHTGMLGAPGGASLWGRGAFETPVGAVPVEREFSERLARRCSLVAEDHAAHRREHAIEVELPFLKLLSPETAIVPLVLAWDDWARCEELAGAVAATVRESPTAVLIVASSDMTHYESAQRAAEKDRFALDAIEALDGANLLDVCRTRHVTMCGRAPAAVALEAARQLGATAGEVVDYRHSGWVTGDDSSVVAYAGVVVPAPTS